MAISLLSLTSSLPAESLADPPRDAEEIEHQRIMLPRVWRPFVPSYASLIS